jgi:hypothetical protein
MGECLGLFRIFQEACKGVQVIFRQEHIQERLPQVNELCTDQVKRSDGLQKGGDHILYPPPVEGISPTFPDIRVNCHDVFLLEISIA